MMKKKIISVFICLLLIGMIPVVAGMNNYDKIETETDSDIVMAISIFGLFPKITENNITFWALAWFTIPKCKFIGHIGTVLIYGIYYDPY